MFRFVVQDTRLECVTLYKKNDIFISQQIHSCISQQRHVLFFSYCSTKTYFGYSKGPSHKNTKSLRKKLMDKKNIHSLLCLSGCLKFNLICYARIDLYLRKYHNLFCWVIFFSWHGTNIDKKQLCIRLHFINVLLRSLWDTRPCFALAAT